MIEWRNVRRSLSDVWMKLLQRSNEELPTVEDHFDPYSCYKTENDMSVKTIKRSDSQTFKDHIRSGFQCDIEDSLGMTPTMAAIMNGDFEEAKIQHQTHVYDLLDNMNSRMQENVRIQEWSKVEISILEDLVSKLKLKGWYSEEIGEILAKITTELQIQDIVCFNDSDITKGFLQMKSEPFLRDTYRAFEIVTPTLDLEHIQVILENNLRKNVTVLMFCRYIMNNIDYYHKTRSGREFLKKIFSWKIFKEDSVEYLEAAFLEADIKCQKIFMKYNFHLNVKVEDSRYLFGCFSSNNSDKEDRLFGYERWTYSNQRSVSLSRKKRNKVYERAYDRWMYSNSKVSSYKNKRSKNDKCNGCDKWIYS